MSRVGVIATAAQNRRTLRWNQDDALDGLHAAFDAGHARTQCIMACGTGKTRVEFELVFDQRIVPRGGVAIFFAPWLPLMRQHVAAAESEAATDFSYLVVASDRDIVDSDGLPDGLDRVAVTTDVADVGRFLRTGAPDGAPRIIFCTYRSAQVVAAAMAMTVTGPADLLIFDEAHHAAGGQNSENALALSDDKVPARRRAFFTATRNVGMLDEETFGPVAYHLSFDEAIKGGLLVPYTLVVAGGDDEATDLFDATLEEVRDYHSPDEALRLEAVARNDRRLFANAYWLLRSARQHDCRRIVAFLTRQEQADRFGEILRRAALAMNIPVRVAVCHGDTKTPERERVFDLLRDDDERLTIIPSVNVLAEGVDIPAIDGVAIIDPRKSDVDLTQIIGRCLRWHPNKRHGLVFASVIKEPDSDDEAMQKSIASARSRRRKCLQVIHNCLFYATDHMLANVDRHRAFAARGSRSGPPPAMAAEIVGLNPDAVASLHGEIIDASPPTDEVYYQCFLAFVANGGSARIHVGKVYRDLEIGRWKNGRCIAYARGELSPDEIERYQNLRGWDWEVQYPEDDVEREGLDLLVGLSRRNGNCWVPPGLRAEGLDMWDWSARVRRNHLYSPTHGSRRQELVALPGWTYQHGQAWNQAHIDALRDLVAQDLPVPNHDDPSIHMGVTLGPWLAMVDDQGDERLKLRVKRALNQQQDVDLINATVDLRPLKHLGDVEIDQIASFVLRSVARSLIQGDGTSATPGLRDLVDVIERDAKTLHLDLSTQRIGQALGHLIGGGDVPLIIREGLGVTLTPAGLRAAEILDGVDTALPPSPMEKRALNHLGAAVTAEALQRRADDLLARLEQAVMTSDHALRREISREMLRVAQLHGLALDGIVPVDLPGRFDADAWRTFHDACTQIVEARRPAQDPAHAAVYIEELELSNRTYNALKRRGIQTLADLLEHRAEDLLSFRNFGRKALDDVYGVLDARGLGLCDDRPID